MGRGPRGKGGGGDRDRDRDRVGIGSRSHDVMFGMCCIVSMMMVNIYIYLFTERLEECENNPVAIFYICVLYT